MNNAGNTSRTNNFRKNMIWNLFGASSNALTSLFLMIIVTRVNGIQDSGIFTLAFSLACLFCIFGGYQGRIFQVTDVTNEFNDKEYIIHRFLCVFLMLIFALLYSIIKGYGFYQLSITLLLCLLKGLEVLADVFYGIMQKNDVLYKSGFSLTIKSVISMIIFLAIDIITKDLIISCIVMCSIWLALLLIYDIPQAKKYVASNKNVDYKNMMKIFKSGFFAFAILFLSIYLVNAPKYALDGKVTADLIAIYGFILMPATVLSLCAQYILQPFLPRLSTYKAHGQWIEFYKLVRFLLMIILVLGILAIFTGWFIGLPVLNFIYGVNLDGYLYPFIIIIIGAVFYALCILLSAVLTTMRKTFQQFIMYAIISVIAYISSIVLIDLFQINGASFSYFVIMFSQFIVYFLYYSLVLKKLIKQEGEQNANY